MKLTSKRMYTLTMKGCWSRKHKQHQLHARCIEVYSGAFVHREIETEFMFIGVSCSDALIQLFLS